jgi:hypothetical protein
MALGTAALDGGARRLDRCARRDELGDYKSARLSGFVGRFARAEMLFKILFDHVEILIKHFASNIVRLDLADTSAAGHAVLIGVYHPSGQTSPPLPRRTFEAPGGRACHGPGRYWCGRTAGDRHANSGQTQDWPPQHPAHGAFHAVEDGAGQGLLAITTLGLDSHSLDGNLKRARHARTVRVPLPTTELVADALEPHLEPAPRTPTAALMRQEQKSHSKFNEDHDMTDAAAVAGSWASSSGWTKRLWERARRRWASERCCLIAAPSMPTR